jgi:hypothetical protein
MIDMIIGIGAATVIIFSFYFMLIGISKIMGDYNNDK